MAVPDAAVTLDRSPAQGVPYAACALVGLGGLFAGVTGPLVSTFLPPLVQKVLGDDRTAIGLVMALDNVLLLLVPLAGAASDRLRSRGRGRRSLGGAAASWPRCFSCASRSAARLEIR